MVRFEWAALDAWYEDDEQVYVHPRNPYTRVDAIWSTQRVRIELGGMVLAESCSPVMVFETGLPTRYYAQSAALELHVPQWRFAPSGPAGHGGRSGGVHRGGTERHPDRVVFDLDPGPGAGLAECVEVAFLVKERLGSLGQLIVPVTSGSKGMHLYVPLPERSAPRPGPGGPSRSLRKCRRRCPGWWCGR